MTVELALDIIGWAGAVTLLFAYAMVSTERWPGRSLRFQLLNVLGSAGLAANNVYHGAYPSAAVNTIWIGIAVFAVAAARRMPAAPR